MGVVHISWTTPRTYTTGEIVTAATLNTDHRDNLNDLRLAWAAWTAFTPTWTAETTNPVIGNGTLAGAYLLMGKTLFVNIYVKAGSTTTFGAGEWRFALPASLAATTTRRQVLHGMAQDASTANRVPLSGRLSDSGTLVDRIGSGSGSTGVTSTVPFTWATDDLLSLEGVIEVA